MKEVFITGADGMLGNSVCRELIEKNYVVKAYCMNEASSQSIANLGIEIVYGNILDADTLLKEIKGVDYVIHLAASTSVWPSRNKQVYQINVEGTRNVMNASKEAGVKRMIFISSASVFEPGTLEHPGIENSGSKNWNHGLDYIQSKMDAQNLLLEEFKATHFPVIIINPTFMIGPYDSGPSSGKMIIGMFNNSIPGYTYGGKNFIYSKDVAVAIVNALCMGRTGECYIAGNVNLSYDSFFKEICSVSGQTFRLRKIASPLVVLIGFCNSVYARALRRKPKLSYGMSKLAVIQQYYSPEKARKELGLPSTDIHVGIQKSIEWFKANGYLK